MRLTTLASIAVIGLSTAALAQVGSRPAEQKVGDGNDMEVAANIASAAPANSSNTVAPANTTATPDGATPNGNVSRAAPPAGEPDEATSAPPKP